MNALLQRSQDPQRQKFEAALAARVAVLFERCPALCGFSVQQGEPDLLDLTCYPTPDRERAELIFGEVSGMLFELVDEQPEAAQLLRGRTFARIFH
jgi:hypothetical protein